MASKRRDLRSVLVIGSGPIVIGQACEFDYSGTQACRVLRAEGVRVVLVNSNPATIMTDPEFADATYVEPITPEVVAKVIERERPDALLATLGGQTALNTAMALHRAGVLRGYGVELIGASIDAIEAGENRERFKQVVSSVGAETPHSVVCHTLAECFAVVGGEPREAAGRSPHSRLRSDTAAVGDTLGYPVVVRPSFTMGGAGSGMAYDEVDLRRIAGAGLAASPTSEVLLEESIIGWKEYELELMRDRHDNVVVVCSIENLDPMGVHTGDSITVAPAMTLTDREYQRMRDVAIAVIRAVGVDTGGCNIQFAVEPNTGQMVVIEMNPRVSRSSALASKATGFPIAKIAAKLALGYTLDEIPNDITGQTPASFEPALDYVVVKVPRFTFEKFPAADPVLTTHMKSVGEAMAIGRNFTEALQKALRSLDVVAAPFAWLITPHEGHRHSPSGAPSPDAPARSIGMPAIGQVDGGPCRAGSRPRDTDSVKADLLRAAAWPRDGRLQAVMAAIRTGASVNEVYEATGIDPWFVDQLALLDEIAAELAQAPQLTESVLRRAKRHGFSDKQIAQIRSAAPACTGETRGCAVDEQLIRTLRHALGIRPVYKTVDTCAGEFAASTPYHYSCYDEETEVAAQPDRAKVIILGSGPNRIGQGIEFDYSCVHATTALREAGFETVMVNCNPETVSTDYDTSDRLYFEPLTLEDVLEVVHAEQQSGRVAGVIVQLGGQTPLRLAQALKDAGVPIVGTSPEAIHLAEERGAFGRVLAEAGLPAPRHGTASNAAQACAIAADIGFPVLVRPSYVLGGRGMEIVYDEPALRAAFDRITLGAEVGQSFAGCLVDRFLDDAVEIDVDALYDGRELYLGGVMEHIEEAGIHSGDSACVLPPITLGREELDRIRRSTEAIARGLGVCGLINVQYALVGDVLYVLEANPRASRTVPFVSKATAVPLAKAAARVMLSASIAELRDERLLPRGDAMDLPLSAPTAVKEAVMPWSRFRTPDGRGVDTVLGPEMRSTGEVMGIDRAFGIAYAKSQAAAYGSLPRGGRAFVSVANRDKRAMIFPVKRLADLGFQILATRGTADVLGRNGIPATAVRKHSEGPGADGEPTVVQRILAGEIDLIVNTPFGTADNAAPRADGYEIRTAAVASGVPCITTVQGLAAAVLGVEAVRSGGIMVRSLQEYAAELAEARRVDGTAHPGTLQAEGRR
jgi:carbamoyl-phosphate synthase large subunit